MYKSLISMAISLTLFFTQSVVAATIETKVVLLGTGTPNPELDRLGPATAIIVGDQVYLIDFGVGVARAAGAAEENGVAALAQENLTIAFLTHIHSDHTLGIADLMLTPWVLGRLDPLRVYGPTGTQKLVDHTIKAFEDDIKLRTEGTQPSNDTGWKTEVTEIGPGLVFEDSLVKVYAIEVCHGEIPNSYGYRFETPDKMIVISGDTGFCPPLIEAAQGADILIHEVFSDEGFTHLPEEWKIYHKAHHTSASEVAFTANQVQPDLLILHHQLSWGGVPLETILEEVKAGYDGEVAFGRDGDVY